MTIQDRIGFLDEILVEPTLVDPGLVPTHQQERLLVGSKAKAVRYW